MNSERLEGLGGHEVRYSEPCPIPIICTPEEMVDDDSEDKES